MFFLSLEYKCIFTVFIKGIRSDHLKSFFYPFGFDRLEKVLFLMNYSCYIVLYLISMKFSSFTLLASKIFFIFFHFPVMFFLLSSFLIWLIPLNISYWEPLDDGTIGRSLAPFGFRSNKPYTKQICDYSIYNFLKVLNNII